MRFFMGVGCLRDKDRKCGGITAGTP
jgi:hypothetical protein